MHRRLFRGSLVHELAPSRGPHRGQRVEVRFDRHVRELVVATVEVDVRPGEQRQRGVEHLVGPPAALGLVHPASFELRAVPARADAEDEAVTREQVERRDLLGQNSGLAQRQDQDRRAEPDAFGYRGDMRQGHQRIEPADPIEPMRRDDVVGDPQRVELELFGPLGEAAHVLGMALLAPRDDVRGQEDPELHAPDPSRSPTSTRTFVRAERSS